MARKIGTALEMGGNELLNVRAQNLGSAPSTPQPGWFYFDTVTQRFMWRGATSWVDGLDRTSHVGVQPASTISDFDTQVRTSRLDQLAAPTGPVSLANQKLTGVAAGVDAGDVVVKSQLDAVSTSVTTTRLDQLAAPTGPVNLNNQKITSLADGSAATDAASYGQVQTLAAKTLDKIPAPVAAVLFNNQPLTGLAASVATDSAVTLAQLNAVSAGVTATRLDQLAAPTGPVNLNGQVITSLADGVAATDAASTGQVQTLAARTLDKVPAPVAAVLFNNQPLTGLAASVAVDSAVTLAQLNAVSAGVTATRLDQLAAPAGPVNLNSQKITSLADGTVATDAASYGQVQTLAAKTLDKIPQPVAAVAFNGQTLTGLSAGLTADSAVNKAQLDAVSAGATSLALDDLAAPTGPVDLGGQKITNLAAPVAQNDAARLADVTAAVNGTSWKPSARVASTAPVTVFTGVIVIDGIQLEDGDRALLKNQTDKRENQIYRYNGTSLFVAADELKSGSVISILEGTTNADTAWRLNTDGDIDAGSTPLDWGPFANPFAPVAGPGVLIDGSTISADYTAVVRKAAFTIGDGSTLTYPCAHNLGTTDVTVGVFQVSTGEEVITDIVRTSASVVTIGFAAAPAAGAYRVAVHG